MTIANPPMVDDFRRDALPRIADGLVVAVAASLPWSTSATGVLTALWLLATLPTLSVEALRREVASAPGGLPVLLAIFAAAGMAWADVPIAERFHGVESFLRLIAIPVLFVQFRRSDRGLRGLHLRLIRKVGLNCIVKILLANGIGFCQRTVLLHVKLTLELVRLSRRESRFLLGQLRFCLR